MTERIRRAGAVVAGLAGRAKRREWPAPGSETYLVVGIVLAALWNFAVPMVLAPEPPAAAVEPAPGSLRAEAARLRREVEACVRETGALTVHRCARTADDLLGAAADYLRRTGDPPEARDDALVGTSVAGQVIAHTEAACRLLGIREACVEMERLQRRPGTEPPPPAQGTRTEEGSQR